MAYEFGAGASPAPPVQAFEISATGRFLPSPGQNRRRTIPDTHILDTRILDTRVETVGES